MLLEKKHRKTNKISQLKSWTLLEEKIMSNKWSSLLIRSRRVIKNFKLNHHALRETLEITFWK